jgi:hypothetical protein
VVDLSNIPEAVLRDQPAHRLVNAKFPPIDLFDDVASNDEFEAVYRLQSLSNPRLLDAAGQIHLVPPERRPFGIAGCNYALAPFMHVNKLGSRFSRGQFGILYAAEHIDTAIAETRHHQQQYFQTRINGLKYDRIIMRGLKLSFSATLLNIYAPRVAQFGWYDPTDYSASQQLGEAVKTADKDGLWYESVRRPGHSCYALFSPHTVHAMIPTQHYEYIWDGSRISDVIALSQ